MSHAAAARPDAATAALGRGIRVYAGIWTVTIAGLLGSGLAGWVELPAPLPVAIPIGAVLLVLNAGFATRHWEDLVCRPGGRLLVEAYPFATALMGAGLAAFGPWSPNWALAMVAAVALGAITCRRSTMLVLTGLCVAGLVVAGMRTGGPDVVLTVSQIGTVVTVAAIAWETGRLYRVAVARLARRAERLVDEQAELRRLDRLKDDFVATVSHELRTPLAVVVGLSETLKRHGDQLDEGIRDDLVDRLAANATGLRDVIESLLDFSRLQRGLVEVLPRPVDAGALVKALAHRMSPMAPEHGLEVRATVGVEVVADPILLERVLENLVTNAFRHTPPGTTVTVRVSASEADGLAILEVGDDGPGIAPDELEHLTERFYRGSGEHTTRATKGLGLGLALCKEILELHGTTLLIASQPPDGARFGFALPLAVPEQVPPVPAEAVTTA